MTTPRFLVLIGAILGLLVAIPMIARGHEAYDYRCCGERDCAAVPDRMVHEAGDVVIFRIEPGSHPMWPTDKAAALVVEVERFRVESRRIDGRWHLCLNSAAFPLCVYPPERGM